MTTVFWLLTIAAFLVTFTSFMLYSRSRKPLYGRLSVAALVAMFTFATVSVALRF